MELVFTDIAVFIGFFVVVIGVSLFKSRWEKSSEDYFLAGCGLSWPLIGLAIDGGDRFHLLPKQDSPCHPAGKICGDARGVRGCTGGSRR